MLTNVLKSPVHSKLHALTPAPANKDSCDFDLPPLWNDLEVPESGVDDSDSDYEPDYRLYLHHEADSPTPNMVAYAQRTQRPPSPPWPEVTPFDFSVHGCSEWEREEALLVKMGPEEAMKRIAQFQENVNKKALIDWVRVTGLPNPRKRKIDRLLEDFATDILKYNKPQPFSWPVPAGTHGGLLAIRARITYEFWKFFMSEGRKTLYEYNSTNGTDIKISREKTITLEDQDRLGLYIRKIIKDEYKRINKKGVEVTLKKSLLKIGDYQPVKPAIAAIMLDIDIEAWSGLPLEQLLTEKEKESLEKGEIKRGSMQLPDITLSKHTRMVDEQGEIANGINVVNEEEEKENQEDEDRPTTSKKRSSDPVEDEPSIKKRMLQ
ncbi:unnamed protein product [Cylicocyclus nassatus]|uniref:Uncharacterized protein n=1 Tax=Cylicocyclus nassatus TaxID=53992 RepID=A0AA36GEU7_CYLNA|nr:unnamed protein product [Cylicocyclus nassatus]